MDTEELLSQERNLSDELADALRILLERIETEPAMDKVYRFMRFNSRLRRDLDDQGEVVELALHEDLQTAFKAYYKWKDQTE